jgi:hypothetical protein
MGTRKLHDDGSLDHRPAAQARVCKANNAKSLMDERQQVIEEYIASLRDFMKSILRRMN